MRAENFIAFFTVCGFFIGLMFVTLKVSEPIEMMVYTFLITFVFYLLIHIIIMNYIDAKRILKGHSKEEYEETADYLISELGIREKRIDSLLAKLAVENALIKQTLSSKKHGQSKAKAA
ncbi:MULTISPECIES: hypothetical protein [unclassified Campylobacter]|uniref:hypothetical protein n=1 Tax=Campylobacter TaxID=194 RepID=UPI001472B16D|nr:MULTISPECIES: hypothetical protein [unclassified Campylobacter]